LGIADEAAGVHCGTRECGSFALGNDRVRRLSIEILSLKAEAAAAMIRQFFKEIENQVGWTTQLRWSTGNIDHRKFDGSRLLRQVPAITDLAQLDSTGKEQLRQSKLAMNVTPSDIDFSHDAKFFGEAIAKKVYYGPVYFRRQSEPYITLALAGTRRDAGVSIVEVNLKLVWDLVMQMKVGEHGVAHIVDAEGRVVVHPDSNFQSDFSGLAISRSFNAFNSSRLSSLSRWIISRFSGA
jgi:two-component system, NtrC family, sensor kinase